MKKNVIVGQSGGPTAVINASLYGVVNEALNRKDSFGAVFGMINGIEGFAEGRVMDMEELKRSGELELVKTTPGSYLGSCRYKLPKDLNDEVYPKLFERFKEYDIGYFFYIGGNDSMDTVSKLSRYAEMVGSDICFLGIPKTIDNDLVNTDHTPGFGSAAKYVASTVREISFDASLYDNKKSVTIVEIMGRHAGWLAGSAALATYCGSGPDLVYLPEVDFDMERFFADVHRVYEQKNSVLIAVSEGIHYADGSFVSEAKASATDGFGHAQLGGLAARLAQALKEREHAKVRGIELSLLQRAGAHLASQTDIDEAFAAGKTAVEAAIAGETGKMVALMREMVDGKYTCRMELIPLADVANYEKKVPVEWIVPEGNNVTQDFIDYALPLIQGVPEIPVENGLPRYARLKKVLAK